MHLLKGTSKLRRNFVNKQYPKTGSMDLELRMNYMHLALVIDLWCFGKIFNSVIKFMRVILFMCGACVVWLQIYSSLSTVRIFLQERERDREK